MSPCAKASLLAILLVAASSLAPSPAAETVAGNAQRGARDFRVCAPCHTIEPDRNMTGPSLAGVWNRKAGGLGSFDRYSPTLKSSSVVWDAQSLDEWLKDPPRFIPHNRMTFAGIAEPQARADIIAFLKSISPAAPQKAQQGNGGGMTGEMAGMGGQATDLKAAPPSAQVKSIAYCRDTYHVRTADGETHDFWERNLRLKTDSSDRGPHQGMPALVGAGMMGDRADVIFAGPEEVSGFIKRDCAR